MLRAESGTAGDGDSVEEAGAGPIPDDTTVSSESQHIDDGTGGSGKLNVEVFEVASPSVNSFVPVPSLMEVELVEANSTMVVSYNIGPNGALIPVNGSCFPVASLDNTFMFVADVPPEPISVPLTPSQLVDHDHSYAKDFNKPVKKRATKKGPKVGRPKKKPAPRPPPRRPSVIMELGVPASRSVNTPADINIIRMDLPQRNFESVPLVHPLIQNHWKTTRKGD